VLTSSCIAAFTSFRWNDYGIAASAKAAHPADE